MGRDGGLPGAGGETGSGRTRSWDRTDSTGTGGRVGPRPEDPTWRVIEVGGGVGAPVGSGSGFVSGRPPSPLRVRSGSSERTPGGNPGRLAWVRSGVVGTWVEAGWGSRRLRGLRCGTPRGSGRSRRLRPGRSRSTPEIDPPHSPVRGHWVLEVLRIRHPEGSGRGVFGTAVEVRIKEKE